MLSPNTVGQTVGRPSKSHKFLINCTQFLEWGIVNWRGCVSFWRPGIPFLGGGAFELEWTGVYLNRSVGGFRGSPRFLKTPYQLGRLLKPKLEREQQPRFRWKRTRRQAFLMIVCTQNQRKKWLETFLCVAAVRI